MNIAQNIVDNKKFVVQFIAATNADGQDFHVYVVLKKSDLPELQTKLNSGFPIDFKNEYQVLASGLGHTASEQTKELLLKYNNI